MSSISESDIKKGQAVYTPLLLKLYNVWVLDLSNQWIWRCNKALQVEQFRKNVSANHLDIGVGTGYFLNQCQWPASAQLALMDLNPNCLDAAKKLLEKQSPAVYLADIFKPQPALAGQFDSISMNYLLHCLPGNMENKQEAIANAVAMLAPGGLLFGATILSDESLQTGLSRRLAAFYNKKGIFSNQEDSLEALKKALSKNLSEVEISVEGCVALFKGKKPA